MNNKVQSTTYLFFIDDSGTKSKDNYILRGGFLISASEYILLSKDIKNINIKYFPNIDKEIKWSNITSCIYLKTNNKKIKEKNNCYYLKDYNIRYLKKYLYDIFETLAKYDIKIISNIMTGKIINPEKIIEFELQNLMQRAQYELKGKQDNAILIYDSDSNEKILKLKQAYIKILKTDIFCDDYSNIVSNLFCEISTYSIGIQMADFIEGCIAGTLREYSLSADLYKQYIFKKIRRHYDGSVIGYGLLPTISKIEGLREEIQRKLVDIIYNYEHGNCKVS